MRKLLVIVALPFVMPARAVVLLLAVAATPASFAQNYPSKPVRYIASNSAGNGADVIACLVGKRIGNLKHIFLYY